MKTKHKVLLVIALAFLASWLFGCSSEPVYSSGRVVVEPTPPSGDTDEPYLRSLYSSYNDLYFDNKLPKNTKFFNTLGGTDMADTECDESGENCVMRFNPHYTAAPRTAESAMMHEMCHVKVWTKLLDSNRPPMQDQHAYAHSKPWQSCMLILDTEGAFRHNAIDYYQGR
jgi:hypothetical protein